MIGASFPVPDKPFDRRSPQFRSIMMGYAKYFGLINVHKDGHHIKLSDGFQVKMIEYAMDNMKDPQHIDQGDIAWVIARFVTETIRDMPICISMQMLVRSDKKNKVWWDLCDFILKIHQAYDKLPPSGKGTAPVKSSEGEL